MATDTHINYKARSVEIAFDKIVVDSEFNTRRKIDNIDSLAQSILSLGQTTPVGVVAEGDDYKLVWGFRRMEAIKSLVDNGTEMVVLADVIDSNDLNKLVLLNVQENVSREQLTLSEEFRACEKLSAFMTRDEIADQLGVTRNWITSRLKLSELSEVLLDAVDEGLSVRAAQTINQLPEELHEEFASRAIGQSVGNVSDMVQQRLDEMAGIDPNPTEGDDDLELLDDEDDVTPLDEDVDDVIDIDGESTNALEVFMTNVIEGIEDEDTDRKERMTLVLASIRWNKMVDSDKLMTLMDYAFTDETEAEVEADDADDESDDVELLDDEA